MNHGNYVDTATHTAQEITTVEKSWQDTFLLWTELSCNGVCKVRRQLYYLLQKINVQKLRRHVAKYYLSVLFNCLWGLLLNNPLSWTLIILEIYSYQITHQYPNGKSTYTHTTILFGTTLGMIQWKLDLSVQKEILQINLPRT